MQLHAWTSHDLENGGAGQEPKLQDPRERERGRACRACMQKATTKFRILQRAYRLYGSGELSGFAIHHDSARARLCLCLCLCPSSPNPKRGEGLACYSTHTLVPNLSCLLQQRVFSFFFVFAHFSHGERPICSGISAAWLPPRLDARFLDSLAATIAVLARLDSPRACLSVSSIPTGTPRAGPLIDPRLSRLVTLQHRRQPRTAESASTKGTVTAWIAARNDSICRRRCCFSLQSWWGKARIDGQPGSAACIGEHAPLLLCAPVRDACKLRVSNPPRCCEVEVTRGVFSFSNPSAQKHFCRLRSRRSCACGAAASSMLAAAACHQLFALWGVGPICGIVVAHALAVAELVIREQRYGSSQTVAAIRVRVSRLFCSRSRSWISVSLTGPGQFQARRVRLLFYFSHLV